ncbi:MAG TPA: acyl-CoA desaturase [Tepidisphaeraceae bacterium]|nr:acyl-CoA desaturase [Tepidisphaeraceae bacterium]
MEPKADMVDIDVVPTAPPEHHEHDEHAFEHMTLGTRVANLIGIITPFVGFILAIALLWGRGFDWLHLTLFLSMYMITAVGITVGYHRLFTHKSFRTNKVVQAALAIFGGMAVEGPMLKWVAMHRRHHHHSDRPGDPHSPHHHDEPGVLGVVKGMWHAHVGWIFQGDPVNLRKYIPDLLTERWLKVISDLWWVWSAIGLLVPALIAGLVTMSWTGALLGFVWGGLARVFLVHHVTWSVNSVCHVWGSRPFRSHDHSRNNPIFGVLALGEGWHNNHHAFPTSARHGLRWWEFDASYLIIRGLELVGLAWDVRVPPRERMEAQRNTAT